MIDIIICQGSNCGALFNPDDTKKVCHDKLNRWRREANQVHELFVLTARQYNLVGVTRHKHRSGS